jgi:hypothetical protein
LDESLNWFELVWMGELHTRESGPVSSRNPPAGQGGEMIIFIQQGTLEKSGKNINHWEGVRHR